MNQMQTFNNPDFGDIRTVLVDGEPWMVGRDVATALGYSNPQKAIRDHVDDEDKGVNESFTPGGLQNTTIINESGLYSLILSSKLPTAKKFKRWVTSEVLPAIRKTGSYAQRQDVMQLPDVAPMKEDYINAARILSTCRNSRLPLVIDLLNKAGLAIDTSYLTGRVLQERKEEQIRIEDYDMECEIQDFISRKITEVWDSWPLSLRKEFWDGRVIIEEDQLVDREKLCTLEIWMEFYNGKREGVRSNAKYHRLAAVLRRVVTGDGWMPERFRTYNALYGQQAGYRKVRLAITKYWKGTVYAVPFSMPENEVIQWAFFQGSDDL